MRYTHEKAAPMSKKLKPSVLQYKPQQEVKRPDRPIRAANQKHAFSIYEHDDEDSVWYRCPDKMRGAIDSVPQYLKTWSLKAIEKVVARKTDVEITTRDRQIRISLWREYADAIDGDRMMGVKNICRGICDPKYLYDHLFRKPKKMAYILYPPTDYVRSLEEMLDLSMREVREILTAPNFNDEGKPNVQVMKLKLQVHEKLENRLKGVVSKKIEVHNKNMNLNVSATAEEAGMTTKTVEQLSDDEVEMELKRLDSKIKKLPEKPHSGKGLTNPEVVDVVSVDNTDKTAKGES